MRERGARREVRVPTRDERYIAPRWGNALMPCRVARGRVARGRGVTVMLMRWARPSWASAGLVRISIIRFDHK
jgi:hypothetical protein